MNKLETILLIITFLMFFGILRLVHHDEISIKDDFLFAVWVEGMYVFNYGIPYIYRSLKGNNWCFSIARSQPSFKFYSVGIALVLIIFSLFMPRELKIYWIFISVTLFCVLLIYDLVVNGKH